MYVRSQNGETAAQFNMDFVYLEMILGIGTSCPPFITLAATLEALISGDSVLTKKRRMKKPASFALFMKSTFNVVESTVSKMRLCLFLRHSSRKYSQYWAAFNTES